MVRFANVLGSSVGVVLGLVMLSSLARGQDTPAPSPSEAPSYSTSSPGLFSIDASTPKLTIGFQLGKYVDQHFPVIGGAGIRSRVEPFVQ
ncbi:MAG: hypothetical protein ACP5XB_22320 [Isosphaeraceae bacterium]